MNALKKIIPFFIVAAIVFNFIGCTDSKNQTTDKKTHQEHNGDNIHSHEQQTSDEKDNKNHEGHNH